MHACTAGVADRVIDAQTLPVRTKRSTTADRHVRTTNGVSAPPLVASAHQYRVKVKRTGAYELGGSERRGHSSSRAPRTAACRANRWSGCAGLYPVRFVIFAKR